jgi:hypothetical protein
MLRAVGNLDGSSKGDEVVSRRSLLAIAGGVGFASIVVGRSTLSIAAATPKVPAAADISVHDFGAVGDGATDDLPAFQAAVDALREAATLSRRLFVPWTPNGYRLHGSLVLRGCHGLTIEGNGSLLTGTAHGERVIATRVTIADYPPYYSDVPLTQQVPARYLSGRYRPGDSTVFMTGLGDEGSEIPTTGDWILIKAGDTSDGMDAPYGEYNRVLVANGNSLSLTYPLNHFYSDFADGTVFGVSTINDLVTTDLTLRGLHLHHSTTRGADLLAVMRCKVEDCHFTGAGALHFRGRFADIQLTADLTPDWSSGYRPYALALDTGSSDVTADVKATSSGAAILHLHEGVAKSRFDVDISCGETDPNTTEFWSVVSMNFCRDVQVRGSITNSPLGSAVNVAKSNVYPSWGNDGCEIDVAVMGVLADEVLRCTSDFDVTGASQDVLVAKLDTSSCVFPSLRNASSPGAVGIRKFVQAVGFVASPLSGATESVEKNEAVWTCADSVTQGVELVTDVPPGGWTHAVLNIEVENVDSISEGNVSWRSFATVGSAGQPLDFAGTSVQSISLESGAAGRTTFVRVPLTIGIAERIGFRTQRDGACGSDTVAGSMKLHRAWISYYVLA